MTQRFIMLLVAVLAPGCGVQGEPAIGERASALCAPSRMTVTVRTSSIKDAGTNAGVWAYFGYYDSNNYYHRTDWHKLGNSNNNFERGDVDVFQVDSPGFEVQDIALWRNSSGIKDGWHVYDVRVKDGCANQSERQAIFDQWLPSGGDGTVKWAERTKVIEAHCTECRHLPWVGYQCYPVVCPGQKAPTAIPCGTLPFGRGLGINQSLRSCDNRFRLTLQSDGNLVLYQGDAPLWSTGTWGWPIHRAELQEDGNFVLYADETRSAPIWSSNTWINFPTKLVVQDDGNLVIYRLGGWPSRWDGVPIWASNTCCR